VWSTLDREVANGLAVDADVTGRDIEARYVEVEDGIRR
jgi:hypothetical protein